MSLNLPRSLKGRAPNFYQDPPPCHQDNLKGRSGCGPGARARASLALCPAAKPSVTQKMTSSPRQEEKSPDNILPKTLPEPFLDF